MCNLCQCHSWKLDALGSLRCTTGHATMAMPQRYRSESGLRLPRPPQKMLNWYWRICVVSVKVVTANSWKIDVLGRLEGASDHATTSTSQQEQCKTNLRLAQDPEDTPELILGSEVETLAHGFEAPFLTVFDLSCTCWIFYAAATSAPLLPTYIHTRAHRRQRGPSAPKSQLTILSKSFQKAFKS